MRIVLIALVVVAGCGGSSGGQGDMAGGGGGGGGGGGATDVSAWLGAWSFSGNGTTTITQPSGRPPVNYAKSGTVTITDGTTHDLVATITSSNGQRRTCPPFTLDVSGPTTAVTAPMAQSCVGPGLTTDPNETTNTTVTLTLTSATTMSGHDTGTVTATVAGVPYAGTFDETDTLTKQ
jgi:hypothetical protein